MPTTPLFGFPYPDTTYPDGWVQAIAVAVGGIEDNILSSVAPSFADATARDAAIPAPVTGQWVQQADDEARYYYNGSTWLPFDTKWQTFTPTFASGVTLGNGTFLGWRFRMGKMQKERIRFTLGSSSAITGQITINVTSLENSLTLETLGTASFRDDSLAGNYMSGLVVKLSSTTAGIYATNVAGTYPGLANTSSTVPFTWATSDWFIAKYDLWLA